MPTPYRKARLMGRLTLFATTLIAADSGLSLEAAQPQTSAIEMPAVAPDWNGSQMLLAGTGRRGGGFSSLFSRKKGLPRENGEDFIREDFEDFIGPAGRRTSASGSTGVTSMPAAVPPAAVPPAMTDLDALPPLDLNLPAALDPVAQQPKGVPAVPALGGETTPAVPQTQFRLTRSADYKAVKLDETELFPADVAAAPRAKTKSKKSTNSFLNLFPAEEPEQEQAQPQLFVEAERYVNVDEQWPTDLYPEPEMGLMIDEPLIADADSPIEPTGDPLLDLPVLDLAGIEESVSPSSATTPPALELAESSQIASNESVAEAEYWQAPKQVASDSSGWSALQRRQQEQQWRAAGSAYEAERSVTSNGWIASRRREEQPTGVASTRTAHLPGQQSPATAGSAVTTAPAAVTPTPVPTNSVQPIPANTVAMSPIAEMPPSDAIASNTTTRVEPIPVQQPLVDGVDNAFVPGEADIAANESLDLTPPPLDMTPSVDQSEREEKVAKTLTNREGLTGLKGFCPVTLCEHRDLIDADPRFAAVYNDRTYYVSTYEALLQFQEDPEKYAPVVGGLDVVALARDGVEIDGILDHAAWYRGQLYLFATAELLAEFSADPRTYAVK